MNTEEKILEILEKLNSRMENLESGQAAFEGRMGHLGAALAELQKGQEQMRVEQAQIGDDLTSVKLRLELDIEKRFDAVNEGIDAILDKLTPKSRVDELEADVVVLKSAVKLLSQEVAELKKAQ